MCGIAGIFDPTGGPARVDAMRAMLTTLAHRGPDGSGWMADSTAGLTTGGDARAIEPSAGAASSAGMDGPSIVLGHRRLAITDRHARGAQPMTRSGRWWITFNGAIYNAPELRAELRDLGEQFRTSTDTEVLLAAWERWGEAALPRLNGMWAFAIWDRVARELVCVRDRFGVKPLVFHVDSKGTFAFASEPKALRVLGPTRAEPTAVQRFLHYGASSGDAETPFVGIRALPRGSLIRVGTRIVERRWFDWEPVEPPRSFGAAAERLRELLSSSVDLRLRADAPIGACLSGGVDSSTLVMLSASDSRFSGKTVSMAHPTRPDIDESAHANVVARAAGCSISFVSMNEADFERELDDHVRQKEDFFAQSGDLAQRLLFRRAALDGSRVMLSGQGADELFAGYEPWMVFLADLRGRGRGGRAVIEAVLSTRRRNGWIRGLRTGLGEAARVFGLLGRQGFDEPPVTWLGPRALENGLSLMSLDDGESFARYLDATFDVHLAGLLRSEDRNSMASGVECRLPFLDHRVVAFARSLPFEFLLRDGWTKAVLRESVAEVLPPSILRRPTKLGFPGPMEATATPNLHATHRAWNVLEREGWVRGGFPVDPFSPGGKRLGLRARITEAWLRLCVG